MRAGLSLPRQPKKEKSGESPWVVARKCSKRNWIEKSCLGWPSSANSTSSRRHILYARDEEYSSCWDRTILQRLLKLRSDMVTSVFPFKVVLPSMMELVVKQLWPILITYLGTAARQDGCLPSVSTFKSPQLQNDSSSPPSDTMRVALSYSRSSQQEVPFIPWECMFIGVQEERAHHTWKLVLILLSRRKINRLWVKAVAPATFFL